jgi:hypothetical protein
MIDKKVFHAFLDEVKGVEKQKKKYEKAARIQRTEREPFPYWDEVFMIIGGSMMLSFFVIFMILTKITF